MGVKLTETPDENLLEKKPTDQKRVGSVNLGAVLETGTKLPQNNKTKLDHQMPNKPAIVLKKNAVDLQKEGACEIAPIKLDMEHLPAFLAINTEFTVKPDVKLECQPDSNTWERDYFQALYDFLYYWRFEADLKKDFSKEGRNEFLDFYREKMDLFEEFFPLPEKHKLFVEGLAKILDKWYKDDSVLKHNIFLLLLESINLYKEEKHADIFKTPNGFLSFLKDEKPFPKKLSPNTNIVTVAIKYPFFERKLKKLLKNNNKPEDPQDIESKIKAFVESSLNKNSIAGKRSFFDAMKDEISKHRHLTKEDMRRAGDLWRKIRREIMGNGLSVKASKITVNGNVIPEQCIPAVEEFLGSIVKENEASFLGKWDSAKLPQDSKIRQDLVAAALASLMGYYSYEHRDPRLRDKIFNSLGNLRHSFSQLTEQERMAVMCKEVKCGEKSFPLLSLLFLDSRGSRGWDFANIIKDFVPKVFDIKFQIKGDKREYDIIGLLEKIEVIRNKPKDKNISEKESTHYAFLESLGSALYVLRRIKNILNEQKDQENKAQEPQKSKEKPSTLMHEAEKEKLEQSPERVVAL